jgi:serine/threonine-protein kinase SRPK3
MSCNDSEDQSAYIRGGYHPVHIGEKYYDERYIIEKKLGWGQFSTVWLAEDVKATKKVAIKIQKSASIYTESAMEEIKIFEQLGNGSCHQKCITFIEYFTHFGPNGNHFCLVFAPLGKNLLWLIEHYNNKGIPLDECKKIARDCLEGIQFVHSRGIIHTDVKPENFLMDNENKKTDSGYFSPTCVYVSDLGNGITNGDQSNYNLVTRQYRPPEVIIEGVITTAIDIFSLGCMFFELLTGEYLFDPQKENARRKFSRDDDHLALMMELLGRFPSDFIKTGNKRKHFFDSNEELKRIGEIDEWHLIDVIVEKFKLPQDEANQLNEFLLPMLQIDPLKRATATQMLSHPWLSSKSAIHNIGKCRSDALKRPKEGFKQEVKSDYELDISTLFIE